MKPLPTLALLVVAACDRARVEPPSRSALLRAADELLAVDRAFAAAAATTDLVAGVTAMFAADVVVSAQGSFADGIAAASAVLRGDTLNLTSRAHWEPVRTGISADGSHGFTIGNFDVARADGSVIPGKYLAYWVNGVEGWRVKVWRRGRRPDGPADTTRFEPSLPSHIVAPTADTGVIAGHRWALEQAERDFSAEAQVVGIGPAFAKFGRADAMHLGGPDIVGFIVGNDAIAASVQEGTPEGTSPVTWGPERAIVASSGDLGVTIGWIVAKNSPRGGGAPARFPFFTIWRRDEVGSPWRYIAE